MMLVGIVGGSMQYARPFRLSSYQVEEYDGDAGKYDLVVFTGGEDVDPALYDEAPHKLTHTNPERDIYELGVYYACSKESTPMVGICRGAQFLNVMNGGKLHQHIEDHTISHPMFVPSLNTSFMVTSTHHQMMRPTDKAIVLAYASNIAFEGDAEPEVVWYNSTKCLCVQYHPEYMNYDSEGFKYFQQLVEQLYA